MVYHPLWRRFWLLVLLLFCCRTASAYKGEERTVLVINSYTESFLWTDYAFDGMINHFNHIGQRVKFSMESLNTQLLNSPDEIHARKERILHSCKALSPKTIVLLGNPAFIFFRDELRERWRDVPVVLCADSDYVGSMEACISKQEIDPNAEQPLSEAVQGLNMTVIRCPVYVEKTVETMTHLLPEMKRLALISDRRYVSAQVRHEVGEVMARRFPGIEVNYLTNNPLSLDGLIDSIRSYDHTTGILFYSWIQEKIQLGNRYMQANNYKILIGITSEPIFSLSDVDIHSGNLAGGCFYSGEEMGHSLAGVVSQVLDGRNVSQIPWTEAGPAQTTLCYNVLQAAGIPESLYPDDAVYLFVPPTFFELYRDQTILGLLLLLVAVVAAWLYFRYRSKLRKKEMSMLLKYKTLFDNMPVAFFKHRLLRDKRGEATDFVLADANMLYANSITGKRFPVGSLGSEMSGEIKGYLEMYREVLQCNKSYSFEYHHEMNDNYYELKVTPAAEPDTVDIYTVNITKLRKTQALVESVNHKLAMALDVADIVPWKWDLVGRTILCDVKRPFEYQRDGQGERDEEALSVPESEYFSKIHKDDRDRVERAYARLIRGEVTKVREEYRVLHRKDHRTEFEWVEAQATVDSRDEEGRPLTLVGSSVVVTSRKKMEMELVSAKDRAEESNRLKSAFLANMSHEIRTPLNAIVGFSNILSNTDKVEEKQEYATIIENNNELLLQLINDILDISKIEAGTLEFNYTDFNLNNMMHELEHMFRLRVEGRPIEVSCEISLPFCHIHSEKNRLMQVLTNMLVNAVKFTQRGSIRLGYRQQEDGMLYFYVSDTGCGIPNDKKETVFGRFIKLNSFQQGTGLGLSICETIVTKLGGRIGVDSEEGVGSTFWFTTPYHPVSTFPMHSSDDDPQLACRQVVDRDRLKILIAEDTESNYRLFASILKNDYRLLHARDGKEAVELFREHEPHLILMDINMPVMNGYEAVERIRKISAKVPIIAVTAYAFEQDEQKILHSGFDAYTSKPINAAMLRSKITALLARSLILI